jgi:hypothetical protein
MILTISGSREMPQKGTKKSSHKKAQEAQKKESSEFSLLGCSLGLQASKLKLEL